MSFLRYKGDHLLLPKLRTWFHKLIRGANTLLCNHLIFQPIEYLCQQDPSLYTDDMTGGTNGENFINLVSNNLAHGAQRDVRWAKLYPNGRSLFGLAAGGQILEPLGLSHLYFLPPPPFKLCLPFANLFLILEPPQHPIIRPFLHSTPMGIAFPLLKSCCHSLPTGVP